MTTMHPISSRPGSAGQSRRSAAHFAHFAPVLALVLAACASERTATRDGDSGRSSAGLSVEANRPVPFCPGAGKACFSGGTVELIVADSLAECAAGSRVDWPDGGEFLDVYLTTVRQHMDAARCHEEGPHLLVDWLSQRANAACNVDAQSKSPATFPLTPLSPALDETYGAVSFPCWDGSGESADELPAFVMKHIHGAAVNACLAQKLRAVMPGTAGAEGLALDRSQQRELLEVIRERAQLALVGYSKLMLAADSVPDTALCSEFPGELADQLRSVSKWLKGQPADHLDGMGQDFKTLVEIHVETTRDLLALFARSASSRELVGSTTQSISDKDWGRGGWRQRATALLYGGDPLSTGKDSSAGWSQVLPTDESWPAYPHVTQVLSGPETYTFGRLARECGAQMFANELAAPFAYDAATTAEVSFKNVEACLRTWACTVKQGGDCVTVKAQDLPGDIHQHPADSLLWQQYRVRPEHVAESMKMLAERVSSTDPTAPPPFLLRGAFHAAPQPADGKIVSFIHPDATFEPTPAVLRAGAMSSMTGSYPSLGGQVEYRTFTLRTGFLGRTS